MDVRRSTIVILSVLVLAILGSTGTAGAALRPDPSFGTGGVVRLPEHRASTESEEGSSPEAMAEEPDGSLIVAYGGTLRRLDPAGHLDRTFGEGGKVTPPPLAGGSFAIAAVAVDGKGRIVVAGTSIPSHPPGKELPFHLDWTTTEPREAAHTDARILRYLPGGHLDPSFGKGGIVETDFGLPTPTYEGVKIASAPAVEVTGVAIDGRGRIVLTGGAAQGITSDCFHDDYFPTTSYAALVGRLTESGSLDRSFATGGVFGGRSKFENPLGMEDATEPVITSGQGIVFGRGDGHCARGAGSLGFIHLTPTGKVHGSGEQDVLGGRVFSTAAAPGGSLFLLLAPTKGAPRDASDTILKLGPDGAPDLSFGDRGKVILRLPGESDASEIRVTPDGEILVAGTKVPRIRHHEGEERWWSRFSPMLLGLRPDGSRDPSFGPHGIAVKHIRGWFETGGLWLDSKGRPTITIGYRPKLSAPVGLAAVRFDR